MEVLTKYTINQGDTIHSISQKVYGTIEQTMEIIIANDLEYPFINLLGSEPEKGVKVPGDVLIIPKGIGDSPGMLDTVNEKEVNGSDICLSQGSNEEDMSSKYYGRDVLTNPSHDLQTVSEHDSLKQDLVHRLVTPIGSLICHPDWGSNFLQVTGNKSLYGWREKASIELERCFRSDDRVMDVQNIEVIPINGGIEISCNIITKNDMIPISTVLGRQEVRL